MSNYIKRPEPGRPEITEKQVKKDIVDPSKETKRIEGVDVDVLANAIAKALNLQLPQKIASINNIDTFDNSETLSRLASQMLIDRGKSKANFDNLGNVKETKKDKTEVDNTIDLLGKLDD